MKIRSKSILFIVTLCIACVTTIQIYAMGEGILTKEQIEQAIKGPYSPGLHQQINNSLLRFGFFETVGLRPQVEEWKKAATGEGAPAKPAQPAAPAKPSVSPPPVPPMPTPAPAPAAPVNEVQVLHDQLLSAIQQEPFDPETIKALVLQLDQALKPVQKIQTVLQKQATELLKHAKEIVAPAGPSADDQVARVHKQLDQALRQKPEDDALVESSIQALAEALRELGAQINKGVRQKAVILLDSARTTLQKNQQQKMQIFNENIEKLKKGQANLFDDLNALVKKITDLATRKRLQQELEKAWKEVLPGAEARILINSITSWTPNLYSLIKENIDKIFENDNIDEKTKKELDELLEKAYPKTQRDRPVTPPETQESLDKLRQAVNNITVHSNNQQVANVINQLLALNPSPYPIEHRAVPGQSGAECGYHALLNDIIFALQLRGELQNEKDLRARLLKKWKVEIRAKRKSNNDEWLEWDEIRHLFDLEKKPDGILHNKPITLTTSEDPFNMWHEFISMRDGAQEYAVNEPYIHLFTIGTTQQKEITGAVQPESLLGHWYSLVVYKNSAGKQGYIVADSLGLDRTNDPRTGRIRTIFDALTQLYAQTKQ